MFKNGRSRRGRGAAAHCRCTAFQARDRAGKHGAGLVVRAEVIGDVLVEEGVRERGDQLDSAVDIIEGRIDEPERVKAHQRNAASKGSPSCCDRQSMTVGRGCKGEPRRKHTLKPSALNKIIHNSQFKRRISLEEQKAQKQDSFLRGRQSMTKIPPDDILEGLHKLRIRESEKLKTVLELYDLETHQKKLGPDYHRLKTMVKRSIEQDI